MMYHIEDACEYDHRVWVVGSIDWDNSFSDAPRLSQYTEAVIKYARENNVDHCGGCHQRKPHGALRFSDGLVWCEKQSNWAVTMSLAWGDGTCSGPREYGCSNCWTRKCTP